MGAMSALMLALAVANHTDGFIGESFWTHIAFTCAGLAALAAATNLALSRVIDEDGRFLPEIESSAAPLKRIFPLWFYLPLSVFLAFLFVVVGVGVSWWVAGIFLGPLVAIDVLTLLSLLGFPIASKLSELRGGRARGRGEGRV
jgi:hypothetical protein